MHFQGLAALLVCALTASAQITGITIHNAEPPRAEAAASPEAIDSITASKLRGHVSFLASDLLEGRDSPSRGLDIAAEYIASQFRALDLEPLGDNGYFQTMNWTLVSAAPTGVTLEIDGAVIEKQNFRTTAGGNIDADGEVVELRSGDIAGKIVRLESANRATIADAIPFVRNAQPKIVLIPDEKDTLSASGAFQSTAIIAPGGPPRGAYVYVILTGPAASLVATARTVRFHMPPPVETPARVLNVAGLLRGSDAELSRTVVVASAHYDHVGLRPENAGDKVMNGANDDASGTAVLLETARALASLPLRPKRSIVFLAVAAEEKGLLGSRYYVQHPLWPLENTTAHLNFEMFGRTEDSEYARPGQMTMTGAGSGGRGDAVLHPSARKRRVFRAQRQLCIREGRNTRSHAHARVQLRSVSPGRR